MQHSFQPMPMFRSVCSLEIVQVYLSIVSRDEPLNLRGGEHVKPLGVDDAAEASDEGGGLLFDLGVHAEVSHQVDVADPGAGG